MVAFGKALESRVSRLRVSGTDFPDRASLSRQPSPKRLDSCMAFFRQLHHLAVGSAAVPRQVYASPKAIIRWGPLTWSRFLRDDTRIEDGQNDDRRRDLCPEPSSVDASCDHDGLSGNVASRVAYQTRCA
jgi:hypothetical protein